VIGAPGSGYLPEGGWQASFGFRYQYSDRHFVGTDEQEDREEEGSQVKNALYTADLGLTYGLTDRTSLSVSLPYQVADRSQRISGLDGQRNVTSARGIGDMIVTLRRWMLEPAEHPTENLSLGLGLKFPTGQPNATDTFRFVDENGDVQQEVRTVDQSIQPGDGGLGFLIDVGAFKQFGDFAPYFNGTYLFNPQETSGVKTWRSRPNEAIMSIADQYMVRMGVQWNCASNWTLGLGWRVEGVPVRDAIGGSDGFRRPGYATSIEPSVAYVRGPSVFSAAVPIALIRNRQQSVPDEELDRHGDAAFADWVLLLGWSYRF
jgi:hypothetical protein